jgi:hypothetical protein
MPIAAQNVERPNVPLTRFHNNTGEVLDLALKAPVTLTKHGRAQWKISEAGYYDRLEALAAGNVLSALNREHLFTADLSAAMARLIDAQMPSAEEIARDRWDDD